MIITSYSQKQLKLKSIATDQVDSLVGVFLVMVRTRLRLPILNIGFALKSNKVPRANNGLVNHC